MDEVATIEFPSWTPTSVREEIERQLSRGLADRALLVRIGTDPAVRPVWQELTDRSRDTGEYLYRPKPLPVPWIGTDIAQAQFLRELVCAIVVAMRDGGIEANKGEEAAAVREEMLREAAVVRKIATELRKIADPWARPDAEVMDRAAAWWEQGARALRTADDPFVVKQNRGDNRQRGVQIAIASFFRERLGRDLHGLAATLAGVALDEPPLSEWASRSAFSRSKSG